MVDGGAALVGELEGFGATILCALLTRDKASGHQPVDDTGDIGGVGVEGFGHAAHGDGALRDGVESMDLWDGEIIALSGLGHAGLYPPYKREQILANLFRRYFHVFIIILIKYLTTSNININYNL